jgi:hypothetical protein
VLVTTEIQTAAVLPIDTLYHYQPFNADWLRQTVLRNQIYFSNPKDFNDPWDCRPHYNDDALNDPVYCARLIQRIDESGRKWSRPFDEARHNAQIDSLRSNRSLLKQHLRQFSEGIWGEIKQRYCVYCLSTKADCPLMWAHYADKHLGLCLEFQRDETIFDTTFKISYNDIYPIFDAAENTMMKRLLPLITKSADWSYEEEFRIIAQERRAATPHCTLMTDHNFFTFPPAFLKSVVIGCQMSESDEHKIRKIVAQRTGEPLVVKRAVRVDNRYRLAIELR